MGQHPGRSRSARCRIIGLCAAVPVNPVDPVDPVDTVAPVAPVDPVDPVDPVRNP